MLARSLIALLLLSGCSKGPESDLQYIKKARSAAAEWALVNEQAGQGQVTATYAASMRQWLRKDIKTADSSLTERDSNYAAEIAGLLRQRPDVAPAVLRAASDRLKKTEDELESA